MHYNSFLFYFLPGISLCLSLLVAIASSEVTECEQNCANKCAIADAVCPFAGKCAEIKGVCLQLCDAVCACKTACETRAIAQRVKFDADADQITHVDNVSAHLMCAREDVAAFGACGLECGAKVATGVAKQAVSMTVSSVAPTLMANLPASVQQGFVSLLTRFMPA